MKFCRISRRRRSIVRVPALRAEPTVGANGESQIEQNLEQNWTKLSITEESWKETENRNQHFSVIPFYFDYRLPPSRLGKAQACLVLLSLLCRFRLFWCESNNNIACSLWESTALSDRNYGTFYQKLPYFVFLNIPTRFLNGFLHATAPYFWCS